MRTYRLFPAVADVLVGHQLSAIGTRRKCPHLQLNSLVFCIFLLGFVGFSNIIRNFAPQKE